MFKNLESYRLDPDANHQITFSGGSSSAYQTWHVIEANGGISPNWEIVFDNTSLERWETYDFILDFQREVGVQITCLERGPFGQFTVVNHNSMTRDGRAFRQLVTERIKRRDGTIGPRPLPSDGPRRLCSGELKTKTTHRYLRAKGWSRYYSTIGFRADEADRVERRKKFNDKHPKGVVEGGIGLFPMFDAGVLQQDVIDFGAAIPWWLKIPSWMGNCWPACMMMSEPKLKERIAVALKEDPAAMDVWIEMEEMPRDRNQEFRPGRKSMRQLRDEVIAGDFSVDRKALIKRPECGSCHD